jgi:tripartite-type tricarboxylate transporter receptor subunit TctC
MPTLESATHAAGTSPASPQTRRTHLSRRRLLGAAAGGLLIAPGSAWADAAYPGGPIRLIVGYAPGGAVDAAARIVAEMLRSGLGATVVVENLSGAAGTIAAQRVVGSPADGHTLLAGSSNELAATAAVNPSQAYDPQRDLTAIALVGTAAALWVASRKVGVASMGDCIARVKRAPGRFSYGSPGVGSTLHFAGELLRQRAGLSMVHVPYRSAGALTSDLVSGDLDFAMVSPTAAAPLLRSGRIVALGITSADRLPALPEVPALAEHRGLERFEISGWMALMAPQGLPPDIVARLRQLVRGGLADPAVRQRLAQIGTHAAAGDEDLARWIADERARYAALARFAHIRP